ncbi:MAG: hypothetical protein ACK54J_27255 [Pseudanabaena sp.]
MLNDFVSYVFYYQGFPNKTVAAQYHELSNSFVISFHTCVRDRLNLNSQKATCDRYFRVVYAINLIYTYSFLVILPQISNGWI